MMMNSMRASMTYGTGATTKMDVAVVGASASTPSSPSATMTSNKTMASVQVSASTTAADVLSQALQQGKIRIPEDGSTHRLFEVYEVPPIERWLLDDEQVLSVRESWPEEVQGGCHFEIRQLSPVLQGVIKETRSGRLEKRGGSHKSWKNRYFTLSKVDLGLSYFKVEPKTPKQLNNPLGQWFCGGALVYTVRTLKKAPRPDLCFCIKPRAYPLWPSSRKDFLAAYESGCKFMCAFSEEDRANWVTSIVNLASGAGGAIYGDLRVRHVFNEADEEDAFNSAVLQSRPPPIPGEIDEDDMPEKPSPRGSSGKLTSTSSLGADDPVPINSSEEEELECEGARPKSEDGVRASFRRPTFVKMTPDSMPLGQDAREWDSADVLRWLRESGLDDFKRKFYANGFVGRQLLSLSGNSFKGKEFAPERCDALHAAILDLRKKTRDFLASRPQTSSSGQGNALPPMQDGEDDTLGADSTTKQQESGGGAAAAPTAKKRAPPPPQRSGAPRLNSNDEIYPSMVPTVGMPPLQAQDPAVPGKVPVLISLPAEGVKLRATSKAPEPTTATAASVGDPAGDKPHLSFTSKMRIFGADTTQLKKPGGPPPTIPKPYAKPPPPPANAAAAAAVAAQPSQDDFDLPPPPPDLLSESSAQAYDAFAANQERMQQQPQQGSLVYADSLGPSSAIYGDGNEADELPRPRYEISRNDNSLRARARSENEVLHKYEAIPDNKPPEYGHVGEGGASAPLYGDVEVPRTRKTRPPLHGTNALPESQIYGESPVDSQAIYGDPNQAGQPLYGEIDSGNAPIYGDPNEARGGKAAPIYYGDASEVRNDSAPIYGEAAPMTQRSRGNSAGYQIPTYGDVVLRGAPAIYGDPNEGMRGNSEAIYGTPFQESSSLPEYGEVGSASTAPVYGDPVHLRDSAPVYGDVPAHEVRKPRAASKPPPPVPTRTVSRAAQAPAVPQAPPKPSVPKPAPPPVIAEVYGDVSLSNTGEVLAVYGETVHSPSREPESIYEVSPSMSSIAKETDYEQPPSAPQQDMYTEVDAPLPPLPPVAAEEVNGEAVYNIAHYGESRASGAPSDSLDSGYYESKAKLESQTQAPTEPTYSQDPEADAPAPISAPAPAVVHSQPAPPVDRPTSVVLDASFDAAVQEVSHLMQAMTGNEQPSGDTAAPQAAKSELSAKQASDLVLKSAYVTGALTTEAPENEEEEYVEAKERVLDGIVMEENATPSAPPADAENAAAATAASAATASEIKAPQEAPVQSQDSVPVAISNAAEPTSVGDLDAPLASENSAPLQPPPPPPPLPTLSSPGSAPLLKKPSAVQVPSAVPKTLPASAVPTKPKTAPPPPVVKAKPAVAPKVPPPPVASKPKTDAKASGVLADSAEVVQGSPQPSAPPPPPNSGPPPPPPSTAPPPPPPAVQALIAGASVSAAVAPAPLAPAAGATPPKPVKAPPPKPLVKPSPSKPKEEGVGKSESSAVSSVPPPPPAVSAPPPPPPAVSAPPPPPPAVSAPPPPPPAVSAPPPPPPALSAPPPPPPAVSAPPPPPPTVAAPPPPPPTVAAPSAAPLPSEESSFGFDEEPRILPEEEAGLAYQNLPGEMGALTSAYPAEDESLLKALAQQQHEEEAAAAASAAELESLRKRMESQAKAQQAEDEGEYDPEYQNITPSMCGEEEEDEGEFEPVYQNLADTIAAAAAAAGNKEVADSKDNQNKKQKDVEKEDEGEFDPIYQNIAPGDITAAAEKSLQAARDIEGDKAGEEDEGEFDPIYQNIAPGEGASADALPADQEEGEFDPVYQNLPGLEEVPVKILDDPEYENIDQEA